MAITAQRLKEAREQDGRSVLQLAADMKVQPAEIYAVESGRRGAGPRLLRRYVDVGVMPWDECAEAIMGPKPKRKAA